MRNPTPSPPRWGLSLTALVAVLALAACAAPVQLPQPGLVKRDRAASPGERIALFRQTADRVLRDLDARRGPGLAVWVEFQGQVVYTGWAGLARTEPPVPITGDTVFELASASKPVTATAVMQLVEKGRIRLDDAVTRWLPGLPPAWSAITVKDLLGQTSGIPDYMQHMSAPQLHGLDGLTNAGLLARWRPGPPGSSTPAPPLNFPPGTQAQYSNSNYVLLAEIVAEACAQPFGDCLRQTLFAPLGMAHTRTEAQPDLAGESLALNFAQTRLTSGIRLRTEGPTGIYASIRDMGTWLRAYQAGRIVSPKTVALMTRPVFPGPMQASGERYGMGWTLPPAPSAGRVSPPGLTGLYAHRGQKDGYRTLIRANPLRRVNYIILSNGGDAVDPSAMAVWQAVQTYLEDPPG